MPDMSDFANVSAAPSSFGSTREPNDSANDLMSSTKDLKASLTSSISPAQASCAGQPDAAVASATEAVAPKEEAAECGPFCPREPGPASEDLAGGTFGPDARGAFGVGGVSLAPSALNFGDAGGDTLGTEPESLFDASTFWPLLASGALEELSRGDGAFRGALRSSGGLLGVANRSCAFCWPASDFLGVDSRGGWPLPREPPPVRGVMHLPSLDAFDVVEVRRRGSSLVRLLALPDRTRGGASFPGLAPELRLAFTSPNSGTSPSNPSTSDRGDAVDPLADDCRWDTSTTSDSGRVEGRLVLRRPRKMGVGGSFGSSRLARGLGGGSRDLCDTWECSESTLRSLASSPLPFTVFPVPLRRNSWEAARDICNCSIDLVGIR